MTDIKVRVVEVVDRLSEIKRLCVDSDVFPDKKSLARHQLKLFNERYLLIAELIVLAREFGKTAEGSDKEKGVLLAVLEAQLDDLCVDIRDLKIEVDGSDYDVAEGDD